MVVDGKAGVLFLRGWWRSQWDSHWALWLEPGLALAVCSVLCGIHPVSWLVFTEPRHPARRCGWEPAGRVCSLRCAAVPVCQDSFCPSVCPHVPRDPCFPVSVSLLRLFIVV